MNMYVLLLGNPHAVSVVAASSDVPSLMRHANERYESDRNNDVCWSISPEGYPVADVIHKGKSCSLKIVKTLGV